LKIGISKKNTAIETMVEPRYAIPAVCQSLRLNSPVPIGIAPFNSIKGNIETNSVAMYSLLKTSNKNLPSTSVINLLQKNFKIIPFFT
jgi:hypothetical protein